MGGNFKVIRKYRKQTIMASASTIEGARNLLEESTRKRGQYFIYYPDYALLREPDGPAPRPNLNSAGILTGPSTPEEREIIRSYSPRPTGSNLDKDFERQEKAANKEKIKHLLETGRIPESTDAKRKVGTGERKEIFTHKWSPGRYHEEQNMLGGSRHIKGHRVSGGYRTSPSKDSDDL